MRGTLPGHGHMLPSIRRSRPSSGAGLAPESLAAGHLARRDQYRAHLTLCRRRVRPAHRDYERCTPRPEDWCLTQWPLDEPEPTKYFPSTLPATISHRALVDATKPRWRIERDYQDLKQDLGLGHYEGQGWRGLHHHATLCIAAYGFLISERGAIPPSGPCMLLASHGGNIQHLNCAVWLPEVARAPLPAACWRLLTCSTVPRVPTPLRRAGWTGRPCETGCTGSTGWDRWIGKQNKSWPQRSAVGCRWRNYRT